TEPGRVGVEVEEEQRQESRQVRTRRQRKQDQEQGEAQFLLFRCHADSSPVVPSANGRAYRASRIRRRRAFRGEAVTPPSPCFSIHDLASSSIRSWCRRAPDIVMTT